MNRILAELKQRWQVFSARPGNTHIMLAAGLLLGLVLVMMLGDDSHPDNGDGDNNNPRSLVAETPAPATPVSPVQLPIPLRGQETPAPFDVETAIETDLDTDLVQGPAPARLVIILDDIGNNADAGRRAVALPGAVTYAVLPYTPHGKMLAELAHQTNKEVMLHAPMSNLAGMALGEGGLTLALPEDEFVETLRGAIADIPHIVGVNNHTGSELTAAKEQMQWVMRELKEQGLYFVDSMTTAQSVAASTAVEHDVPTLKRHVFLDNEATHEAIDREFSRALTIAQQQGFAVAIGHPYPQTLDYLEQAIENLPAQGIELVPVSTLLQQAAAWSVIETPGPQT